MPCRAIPGAGAPSRPCRSMLRRHADTMSTGVRCESPRRGIVDGPIKNLVRHSIERTGHRRKTLAESLTSQLIEPSHRNVSGRAGLQRLEGDLKSFREFVFDRLILRPRISGEP